MNTNKIVESSGDEIDDIILQENIKNVIDDNSIEPKWFFKSANTKNKTIDSTTLNIEIGKVIKKVKNIIETHLGNFISLINVIEDIDMTLNLSSEKSKDCKSITEQKIDSDGLPIYMLLKIIIENDKEDCSLTQWCGCIKNTINFSYVYAIMKPKNNAAINKADDLVNQLSEDLDHDIEFFINHT